MSTSLRSISNQHNVKQQCERSFWSWFSLLLPDQLRFDALQMIQQMNVRSLLLVSQRFNWTLLQHHATDLVAKTVSKVRVYIQTRKVTGRLIAGIFLAGCLAPLSDVFYAFDFLTQFPEWNYDTESAWFYDNYADFFLCLGPYFQTLFFTMGVYFLFIPGSDRRRFILIPFCSYPVVKILWLAQVSNKVEFHVIPPFAYWVYGVMLSSLLWVVADYLVYLFNHKVLNTVSTLNNITNNRKHLPAEQAIEMYATTCSKLKSII